MLGTAVVSGMLAATLLGIFFIPALFVVVERLAGGRKKHEKKTEAPATEEKAADRVGDYPGRLPCFSAAPWPSPSPASRPPAQSPRRPRWTRRIAPSRPSPASSTAVSGDGRAPRSHVDDALPGRRSADRCPCRAREWRSPNRSAVPHLLHFERGVECSIDRKCSLLPWNGIDRHPRAGGAFRLRVDARMTYVERVDAEVIVISVEGDIDGQKACVDVGAWLARAGRDGPDEAGQASFSLSPAAARTSSLPAPTAARLRVERHQSPEPRLDEIPVLRRELLEPRRPTRTHPLVHEHEVRPRDRLVVEPRLAVRLRESGAGPRRSAALRPRSEDAPAGSATRRGHARGDPARRPRVHDSKGLQQRVVVHGDLPSCLAASLALDEQVAVARVEVEPVDLLEGADLGHRLGPERRRAFERVEDDALHEVPQRHPVGAASALSTSRMRRSTRTPV